MLMFLKTREGVEFQIDEIDFEEVSKYEWRISNEGYVCNKKGKLHYLLFGLTPKGMARDHINRDKLDNRRENFRLGSIGDNIRNQDLRSDNSTGHTGVYDNGRGGYRAIITIEGEQIFLGSFDTYIEAVIAREEAEQKYWRTRSTQKTDYRSQYQRSRKNRGHES